MFIADIELSQEGSFASFHSVVSFTYKSISGAISNNRGLRIERDDNAVAHREPDLSAIRWSHLSYLKLY